MALATTVTKGQPVCVDGDVAHNYNKRKAGTKQKQQKGVAALLLLRKPNKWPRHRITAAGPSTRQSQPLFQ